MTFSKGETPNTCAEAFNNRKTERLEETGEIRDTPAARTESYDDK